MSFKLERREIEEYWHVFSYVIAGRNHSDHYVAVFSFVNEDLSFRFKNRESARYAQALGKSINKAFHYFFHEDMVGLRL